MTLKLSPKQCWFSLKETAPIKIYLISLFIPCMVFGLQLENWRQPYFLLSSEMQRTISSPSGMFWDNLDSSDLFHSTLWKSGEKLNGNGWFIEPNITTGFLQSPQVDHKPGYYHIELLNNIRFRRFLIRQTLDVDKRFEYDSLYPAHLDRAVRGRIEEAYVQVDWKYGFFRIGRQKRNWGPFADRSLVLSVNPYSFDAVEWQIHSSFFEFRHIFAPFNEKGHYTDNGSETSRFFTAHSLNLIFGDWATIGITEAVLFARQKTFPDLQYVNPFSIYTVVNTNQEGPGNLMLALQWNIHPFVKCISFKGQLAFDDFQVDNEIATDKEPPHYGIDLGVYWNNPFRIPFEHLLKAEYNLRSEWLYTVSDENANLGERYTYNGKSLGFPENDGDRISTAFSVIGKNYWYGTAELAFSRQGIRNALSRWHDSDPGQIPGLPYDTLYTMENTISASMNCGFYYKNFIDLSIGLSGNWIKNKDNIKESVYEFSPSVSAELSIHYSNLFLRFPN